MPMVFKTGVILFDKKPSTRYFGKHKNMDNQLYYITVYIGFIESYIQYSGGMPEKSKEGLAKLILIYTGRIPDTT